MDAEKLSIILPAEMAKIIRSEVESGAYASDSEVVRDAVRVWQEQRQDRERRLAGVRAKIEEAAATPERTTDEELRRHFERRLNEAEQNQAR